MQRVRFVSILAATLVVVMGWSLSWTSLVSAQSESQSEMTVIVMDGSAVREAQRAIPLTMSFISLLATLQDDNSVIFLDTDRPSESIGPFKASDPDFSTRQVEVEARLRSPRPAVLGSMTEALDEARSLLANNDAPVGSTIYVATGGTGDSEYRAIANTVSPLLTRIAEQGWTIHGLRLQDDDPFSELFLGSVSKPTGGTIFSLISSSDLKPLADNIFSRGAKGSLDAVSERTLTTSDLLSSEVSIVPGTKETTLFFFKESRFGSLRLNNPSGLEVSAGDRSASYVIETDNLVIWKLVDPAPGDWKIEAKGIDGNISIWGHTTNVYDLILRTLSPLPVGRASSIMGYVSDGEQTAVFDGSRMYATITGPDSSAKVYEMFDDGTQGDPRAGDGYFSLTLPSLDLAGSYDVTLELSWAEFDHKITSDGKFEAQVFPSFDIDTISVSGIELGEKTQVGTLSIHVDGGPYAVDPATITPLLASPTGEKGTLELVPQRLFGNGPAWQYDLFFTPEERGAHTLQFRLGIEYAGRMYTETSSSIVVSTTPPPVPLASIIEAVVVPAVAVPPGAPVALGAPVLPNPEPPFPWIFVVIPGMIVLALIAIALFLATRPSPYGYIYTDGDDKVVDFSKLERHPILGFFYKGLVRGSELNVPGLEGLVFQFMKDRVDVKSFGEHPTVRVNNQPLIDSASIKDKAWIGTGGKLYTFLTSPRPAPGPAGAD